jgi:hypothetical protein
MTEDSEYVLYILMRTDLPSMNAGKAMAQASHASNAFVHNSRSNIPPIGPLGDKVRKWEKETKQGFGTVLVLGATMDEIVSVREWSIENSFNDDEKYDTVEALFEEVVDPTYPYIVDSEIAPLIGKDIHTGESPVELESGDFLCLRKEVTCAYLFADKNDERIQELLGELSLHP